jgi:hypothetical protein
VIGKETRVREEVVVRKDASERTETVKDTVRRTEVEVEDGGTGAAARATAPGSTATPDAATPEAATADTGMTPTPGTEPTGTETPAGRDAESGRPSPDKGTVKR